MTFKAYTLLIAFCVFESIRYILSAQYIYQLTPLDFHVIAVDFVVSQVEDLLLGLSSENF